MRRGMTAIFLLMSMVPLSVLLAAGSVHAEARSIYVGDVVEIRVTAPQFTRDELLETFREFEFVDVAEHAGGYLVTLRSFEPGEKKVTLGDKELVIVIRSALDDFERDGIFEGEPGVLESGFRPEWRHALFALAAVFAVSGGMVLRRAWTGRKLPAPAASPAALFRSRMDGLSEHDERSAAKMTLYLKEYMESVYSCRIRGKTSAEMMIDIDGLPEVREHAGELGAWLALCDRLKYGGAAGSAAERRQLRERLSTLVGKLDEEKGIGA